LTLDILDTQTFKHIILHRNHYLKKSYLLLK